MCLLLYFTASEHKLVQQHEAWYHLHVVVLCCLHCRIHELCFCKCSLRKEGNRIDG